MSDSDTLVNESTIDTNDITLTQITESLSAASIIDSESQSKVIQQVNNEFIEHTKIEGGNLNDFNTNDIVKNEKDSTNLSLRQIQHLSSGISFQDPILNM
jgi:hypothetical protein